MSVDQSTTVLHVLPAVFNDIREELDHISGAWLAAGAECVLVDRAGLHFLLAGNPTWSSSRVEADLEVFDPVATLVVEGVGPGWAQTRLSADARMLDRLATTRSQLSHTTAALVEANDQALAFHRLATSSTTSLGLVDIMHDLADEAHRLTGAPAIAILAPDSPIVLAGDHDLGKTLLDMVHAEAMSESGVIRRVSSGLTHDVLVTPIGHDEPGLLIVAGPADGRIHSPTRKLAAAIAGHLGGLMKRARSHQQELADARLRQEVEAASFLAAQVLPRRSPAVPGLDLYARNQPARLASGDYYTWTMTRHGLVFAVGDVSGKGLPAALVMTMLSTATTAAAHRDNTGNPAVILAEISADVYDYLSDSGVFVTTVIGVWEPESGVVSIVNAGHSPVLFNQQGCVEPVPPHVPPLGVLPDVSANAVSFELVPNDLLLIGSDGLVEQADGDGLQFGQDRLAGAVAANQGRTAAELVEKLFVLVESHCGPQPQDDDRTLLVVRRTGARR